MLANTGDIACLLAAGMLCVLWRRQMPWRQASLPHVLTYGCALPSRWVACAGLAAGFLFGGCVQTAMTPAQQIEPGTTVLSASLDEPGVAYVPRLNAQLTHGFGGGDLTATVSIPSLIGVGAGLTGRYYLSDRLTGELQLQAGGILRRTATLALLGIQKGPVNTVNGSVSTGSWYFGGRAGATVGEPPELLDPDRDLSEVETVVAPVVGGTVGYGPMNIGSNWRMQIEVEANAPLSPNDFDLDDVPFPASRLSIGFFRLFR
jgi:hypothetical protein